MERINCKYYDTEEFCNKCFDSNSFSLFHLNIASLPKHFDELKSLLNQTGHDFSIIGLTETAFQSNIPSANCHLDGYSFVHTPAEGPKGGALIYIHNNLEYVERPDLDKLAYKSCELESKFVELVKGNCKNFIIGCISQSLGDANH